MVTLEQKIDLLMQLAIAKDSKDKWCDSKKAEERDRVTHGITR